MAKGCRFRHGWPSYDGLFYALNVNHGRNLTAGLTAWPQPLWIAATDRKPRIRTTANFESLPDALASQRLTVALSKSTKAMFTAYRQGVPFVSQDRVFTPDIAASQKFLEGYAINQK